jgi:hypothetical protein
MAGPLIPSIGLPGPAIPNGAADVRARELDVMRVTVGGALHR